MSDDKITQQQTAQPAADDAEWLDRRRQEDLECLTLLKQAGELRAEAEYLDAMFSLLKDEKPAFAPAVEEILRQLDD